MDTELWELILLIWFIKLNDPYILTLALYVIICHYGPSQENKKIINKILRPIVTNPRATVEPTANVLEGKVR